VIWFWDGDFQSFASAVWWAFLRLTDPGYLGDDQGVSRRTVATVLTVMGYVIFLGALVAILTQWLQQQMARLQMGLTPISLQGHVLVLGWSRKSAEVVRKLLISPERLSVYKERRHLGRFFVVILVDELNDSLREHIRAELGHLWSDRRILVRSGSALRLDHLERVNYRHASAIIIPASEGVFELPSLADGITLKTFLSCVRGLEERRSAAQQLPFLIVELLDREHSRLLKKQYNDCDVVSSNTMVGQMLVQMVFHKGISRVISLLFEQFSDYELRIESWQQAAGLSFAQVRHQVQEAVVIGLIRPQEGEWRPLLAPTADTLVEPGDLLIFLADITDELHWTRDQSEDVVEAEEVLPPTLDLIGQDLELSRQILILGWSRKVVPMLLDLDGMVQKPFKVTLASVLSEQQRRTELEPIRSKLRHIILEFVEVDFCSFTGIQQLELDRFQSIIMLASDWLEDEDNSDVRTIMGYSILKESLPRRHVPNIVLELRDAGNEVIFYDFPVEVLTGPQITAHMLARITLRPELKSIYEELLGPNGAELFLYRLPADPAANLTFKQLSDIVFKQTGEIVLGYAGVGMHDGEMILNPEWNETLELVAGDQLVVIRQSDSG
jgi:Trk K+ transport system NAD-binding subunit